MFMFLIITCACILEHNTVYAPVNLKCFFLSREGGGWWLELPCTNQPYFNMRCMQMIVVTCLDGVTASKLTNHMLYSLYDWVVSIDHYSPYSTFGLYWLRYLRNLSLESLRVNLPDNCYWFVKELANSVTAMLFINKVTLMMIIEVHSNTLAVRHPGHMTLGYIVHVCMYAHYTFPWINIHCYFSTSLCILYM